MLAIIVDGDQQNAHADSEVVCCMLTTTIEQWVNSFRVQKSHGSNEAQLTLQYVWTNCEYTNTGQSSWKRHALLKNYFLSVYGGAAGFAI